jgi:uncharacterized membrane protein (UPF0127 family)
VAWLLREGEVLASLELAESLFARGRGLLGRRECAGAFLLRPQHGVHTIGMRFAIDVAFLDASLVVLDTVTLVPFRFSRPRMRAKSVLEAEAGAFERWGLHSGDRLEIRQVSPE